jgi:hypothetical protein
MMNISRKVFRIKHFAIYILLLCGGWGIRLEIKEADRKKNVTDSLTVEFNKAHDLVHYYNMMQDSSGGVLGNMDMWWAYRDSAYRAIDKMIEISNKQ